MRQILLILFLNLIFVACDSKNNSTIKEEKLKINDPKLSELNSKNTEFSLAIDKIKGHLIKLNIPIDSMYLASLDSTSRDKWEFRIIHYDNYLIQAKSEAEKKRIDSLEKAGVTEYYLNFIAPSGNWGGGHDRTIVYSTVKHEISADLIAQ